MIYFKNVPQYGDLEIEKVLFSYDFCLQGR